jgi:hypothetical protein
MSYAHRKQKTAVSSRFRMARPGLEPGTPRFSDNRTPISNRPKSPACDGFGRVVHVGGEVRKLHGSVRRCGPRVRGRGQSDTENARRFGDEVLLARDWGALALRARSAPGMERRSAGRCARRSCFHTKRQGVGVPAPAVATAEVAVIDSYDRFKPFTARLVVQPRRRRLRLPSWPVRVLPRLLQVDRRRRCQRGACPPRELGRAVVARRRRDGRRRRRR